MKSSENGIVVIVALCCIGVLLLGALGGFFSPDADTSLNVTNNTNYSEINNTSNLHSSNVTYDSSNTSESSSLSDGTTYVASAKSDKFHFENCRYVNRIKPYNKITFSSREQAINAGYSPCKVCCP